MSDSGSEPVKKEKSFKQIRKGKFKARPSKLDWQNEGAQTEFRGFYSLFWISLVISVLDMLFIQYRREGKLRFILLPVMSKDFVRFCFTDLAMCIFSLSAPVLQLILHRLRLPISLAVLVKHVLQTAMIVGTVFYIVQVAEFNWPQSATLCLHALTLYMKMHSYLSYNGELESQYRKLVDLKGQDFVTELFTKDFMDECRARSASSRTQTPVASQATQSSVAQLSTDGILEDAMRKRQVSTDAKENKIAQEDWMVLARELCKGDTAYPHNLTWQNFVIYLFYPTLVYELEYPRTAAIRWDYVVEKLLGFFGVLTLLYLLVEHYITPSLLRVDEYNLGETIVHLLVPFMLGWLMLFYLVFEGLCNTLAELTMFADRHFYEDWWNSISFDEFARKWNRPVHEFLLRHVYLEAIDTYKLTKHRATFVTFLFSSVIHEFVLAVVARRVVMLFFVMQMSQLILIWLWRISYIKRYPAIANALFWVGLMCGLPLTAIFYTREIFLQKLANTVLQ